jgi:hypothetical protein
LEAAGEVEQVGAGEGPVEGLGVLAVVLLEAKDAVFELLRLWKWVGLSALRARIEKVDLVWFS